MPPRARPPRPRPLRPRNIVRRTFFLLLATLAVVTTACGSSGSSSTDAKAGGQGGTMVTINNFEFAPDTVQAKVGDTITVQNKDSTEHTVTATDKSFDTGRFASGTKTFVVSKAGRFEFECTVHPYMKHAFIQVSG